MNNIKSIFPYEQIYQERKRERLQQCEKKGRVVVVNLSALVIIFPSQGELIKEALHKTMKLYTP